MTTMPNNRSVRIWTPSLVAGLLLAGSVYAQTAIDEAETADGEPAAADLPDEEAWEAGPDRETLVRFARAWGQIASVLETEEPDTDPLDDSLAKPEELDADLSRQVRRHIRNNGLDQEQWASLLARMDRDADFRNRVEMLAVPYQTPSQ